MITPGADGRASVAGDGEPEGDWPRAEISNGDATATLYLPDPERGYYRGSRFDWSGVIARLDWRGHSYVDRWFPEYHPRLHDAITGPVDAFLPIGYEAAAPGETFLAIGIGALVRPDHRPYHFSYPYPIADGGEWSSEVFPEAVRFVHQFDDGSGHSYRYVKTVRLLEGEPTMLIEHQLSNLGTEPLETSTFNHNFLILDGAVTGPRLSLRFGFQLEGVGEARGFGELADAQGRQIQYRRDLERAEIVASGFVGFDPTSVSDYHFNIENAETGAGIRITADRPLSKLYFWSIRTTACPEPFVDLSVPPGETTNWTIAYRMYEVEPAH